MRSGRVISNLETPKCEFKAPHPSCILAKQAYIRVKREYIHVYDYNDYPPNHPCCGLALASVGPANAEGLKPFQGQVIDLGDVSAVAYYTVERDGFRVVATLAKKDEDAVPVGVAAVLAPDQSLMLSTPRETGAPADAVEIVRRADTLLVQEAAVALTN